MHYYATCDVEIKQYKFKSSADFPSSSKDDWHSIRLCYVLEISPELFAQWVLSAWYVLSHSHTSHEIVRPYSQLESFVSPSSHSSFTIPPSVSRPSFRPHRTTSSYAYINQSSCNGITLFRLVSIITALKAQKAAKFFHLYPPWFLPLWDYLKLPLKNS